MAAKAMFTLCAILLQSTLSQCLPFSCGFVPTASTGGSFVVTSSSPISPIGISVRSDNTYEGSLFVEGNLPLLGSVAVEGKMGTAGAGAVSYGCGDDVAIAEEGPIITGIAEPGFSRIYGRYGGLYGGLYGLGYGGLYGGLYGLGYGGLYGLGYGGIYGLGRYFNAFY